MDVQTLLKIAQDAILTVFSVSLPLLGAALIVGTVISLFQTVTQIQEQTLTFVPKFIAIMAMLLFMLNWMIKVMVIFTTNLIGNIPNFVR